MLGKFLLCFFVGAVLITVIMGLLGLFAKHVAKKRGIDTSNVKFKVGNPFDK